MSLLRLSSYISPSLERRRGGGGGGHSGNGGHSGGSGSHSGSSGAGETSGTKGSGSGSTGGAGGVSKPISIGAHPEQISTPNFLGGKHVASTYGTGGGSMAKVVSGPFKGMFVGGGTRSEVYGTSVYGSGYPPRYHSSGFPYYYYPVVWGAGPTEYPIYLNRTLEYGQPANASRPGGPLMQATLRSTATGSVFHVLADNATTHALLPIIRANCSRYGDLDNATSSSVPFAYIGGNVSDPNPVDAVQYYRASSAVLTLDGYNNTVILSSTPNATAKPTPAGTDSALLTCLNITIGAAIPLVNHSTSKRTGLAGGAIAGIVIGCLSALVCLWVCCRRGKRERRPVNRSQPWPSTSIPCYDVVPFDDSEYYSVVAKPARASVGPEHEMKVPKAPAVPVSPLNDVLYDGPPWDTREHRPHSATWKR